MNSNSLFASLALVFTFILSPLSQETANAGETGYREAHGKEACLQCPKRHWIHSPYRQCEDSRRYNAAPCTPPRYASSRVFHQPVLIDTIIVSEVTEPHTFIDTKGNRHTSHATVITYKDLYSNGDCRTRTKTIAGSYKY